MLKIKPVKDRESLTILSDKNEYVNVDLYTYEDETFVAFAFRNEEEIDKGLLGKGENADKDLTVKLAVEGLYKEIENS